MDGDSSTKPMEGDTVGERRSGLDVAKDNLATAERVHEKAKKRVETLTADLEKARENERLSGRKVKAARMVALDETTDAINADASPAPVELEGESEGDSDLV
jgi:hypothetical protein